MQKNWYIIYTKSKCEKKVAAILNKRKIENYFPLSSKRIRSSWKKKIHQEPLFNSYVFANLTEFDSNKITSIEGVLNLVYWRGKPATVQQEEIDAIKEFTLSHNDIKLERTQINLNEIPRLVEGPKYSIEGNVLTVKNNTIKVNLPSIGFTMVAEVDSDTILGRGVSFGNKELMLQ